MNFPLHWNTSKEVLEKASEGEVCPHCLLTKIKCEGANPDGIHMNHLYKCRHCGEEWEGK